MRKSARKATAIILLVAFMALICSPYTCHAYFLGGVSLKDEKEMGRKFDAMLRSHMPMVEDPEVRDYINDVLGRLVRSIPVQPFEFKSEVILHNALNAFAVPGGYVFVFTGLIMNLQNEAELAGVLAHELAHVTQRHVASRMERAQYLTLGSLLVAMAGIALGGPGGAAAAMAAAGAGQSAMLNYSRLDESEADNLGLQYLQAARYPLEGMIGGFKVLRQKSWMSGISIPTYLSTHPAIGDRINSLSARIAAMPLQKRQGRLDNRKFMRVQTLLWGRYGDEQAALQRFSGKDGLSLMGRGMVYARQNRVREAAGAFDAALKANPADSLIMREAGIFHYRKGNMAQAGQLLRSAMRSDSRDYMAAFFYARYLADTGDHKSALENYRNVLRYVPQSPEVHEAYAKCLGNTGNQYLAYVHMAYGALYSNNRKLLDRYMDQAKKMAEKSPDKKPYKRLEAAWKERKEIWDKS